MKTFVLKALTKLFPGSELQYAAYQRLIERDDSYLYLTGWMRSLKERKPVDRDGEPIPWMNFSVVTLLAERLTPDLNLFEFGSGYSTLFYASRVKTVTSLEYDDKWLSVVKAKAPENVTLVFQAKDIDGEYCRVVGGMKERYDVVVVDGRDRVNCVMQSVTALSPRGVIILDDSERVKYRPGIEYAAERGFKALDLQGLKATGVGIARTTILYREGNCLGL